MSYYVKDIPNSCSVCDCCHEKSYNQRKKICGKKFCGIENEDVDGYCESESKPKWCPLKQIDNNHKVLNEEEYLFWKLGVAFTQKW